MLELSGYHNLTWSFFFLPNCNKNILRCVFFCFFTASPPPFEETIALVVVVRGMSVHLAVVIGVGVGGGGQQH